jgi:predicted dienelactone hydrolase
MGMAVRSLLLLLLLVACRRPAMPSATLTKATAVESADTEARPRDPVGVATLDLEDATRKRPLATTIWYPAVAGAEEQTIWWDGIFPGSGVWNAALRPDPQRLPLLLLSHGSGGDGTNLAWLAEAFATRGWIVAAVDHPGDRFGDVSNDGRFAAWRRPRDLSVVLTRLLVSPQFGPRIDPQRIAAAGHSSGGFTALLLAGARFDARAMLSYCRGSRKGPDCTLIDGVDPKAIRDFAAAGRSYRDRRVRMVAAMAPAMAQALSAASLRQIAVPVMVVAGVDDELVPFVRNAARVARLIPRARLISIPAAGHFVFMPVCNEPGRLIVAQVCVDPVPDVDREMIHERTVADLAAFLEESLGTQARRRRTVAAR